MWANNPYEPSKLPRKPWVTLPSIRPCKDILKKESQRIKDMNQQKCNCNCNQKVGKTYINIILDRSGSMGSMLEGTITGFNEFIQGQKNLPGECKVTLVHFDHEYEVLYDKVGIKFVAPLTRENFVPRGSTALFDAIGRTYNNFTRTTMVNPEDKVIFLILSDGLNNASTEFTAQGVKKIVESAQRQGYQFTFIGCSQEILSQAQSIGITRDQYFAYAPSNAGMIQGMAAYNQSAVSYRSGLTDRLTSNPVC